MCLGSGTARGSKTLQTYFIVVTSQKLLQLRRDVKELFVSRGGKVTAFDAEAFTPHVTVDFTQRDLFETDGVVKDETSCVAQVDFPSSPSSRSGGAIASRPSPERRHAGAR